MQRTGRVVAAVVAIAVVAALVGILAGRSSKEEQTGLGQVRILSDDVTVTHANAVLPAASSTVGEGDRIQTDTLGLARLEYFDKSITRIGPQSDFVVQRLRTVNGQREVVATLDVGKTWHRVTKAAGTESRYEIKTSNAVAAVRGTALVVTCLTRRICRFGVAAGSVDVTDEEGTKLTVPAGKQVRVVQTKIQEIEDLVIDDFVAQNLRMDQEESIVQATPEPTVLPTTSTTGASTTTTTRTPPTTAAAPSRTPTVVRPPVTSLAEPPYPPRL